MSRNMSVDDARRVMLSAVTPSEPQAVPLDRFAVGRVLAEPISAVRDQPPFDASAMDGWAILCNGAVDADAGFRIVGESAAGRGFEGPVGPGEAVRIFTGAQAPAGCAVMVQEEAERNGDTVWFRTAPPSHRTHVRRKGGDFAEGDVLLRPGVRLDALRLSIAASAGRGVALVAPRPRVAVLSTGEEIVRAGAGQPGPYQIFDSGGPALSTMIAEWGGSPQGLEPARDDETAIVAAVRDVAADLIVTVGGASVGDYDLVKPALTRLGLDINVQSINLRPGKPTWFGRLDDGRLVLGLPGNPASALVAAELFLRPLLMAWQGADATLPMTTARLSAPLGETGPREHWMRAMLSTSADGVQTVTPFPDQDSSLVSVFAQADALLQRPASGQALQVGAPVPVLPLARL